MILAKVNHIEILSVTPEGLRPVKQFTINGRVEVMKFFRPQVRFFREIILHETSSISRNFSDFFQGMDKDRLFIVTAKNNAMILEAQGSGINLEIITKARGDVGDRIGQNAQTGTRAIIDPEARVIGLRIYDSLFKVIPLEKDQSELKAYNIRMEELKVTDIEFLHGCPQVKIKFLINFGLDFVILWVPQGLQDPPGPHLPRNI